MQPDPVILDRLPHRAPFRFVSRVEALDPGRRGVGCWTIGGREDFFAGHFPDDPIVPGVLIAEALAQLSGLVGVTNGESARLAHVDMKFLQSLVPPAEIRLEVELTRSLGALRLFSVIASCAGEAIARGQLTLAITHEPGANIRS